jgi:hypothetical protein
MDPEDLAGGKWKPSIKGDLKGLNFRSIQGLSKP